MVQKQGATCALALRVDLRDHDLVQQRLSHATSILQSGPELEVRGAEAQVQWRALRLRVHLFNPINRSHELGESWRMKHPSEASWLRLRPAPLRKHVQQLWRNRIGSVYSRKRVPMISRSSLCTLRIWMMSTWPLSRITGTPLSYLLSNLE